LLYCSRLRAKAAGETRPGAPWSVEDALSHLHLCRCLFWLLAPVTVQGSSPPTLVNPSPKPQERIKKTAFRALKLPDLIHPPLPQICTSSALTYRPSLPLENSKYWSPKKPQRAIPSSPTSRNTHNPTHGVSPLELRHSNSHSLSPLSSFEHSLIPLTRFPCLALPKFSLLFPLFIPFF